MVHSQPPPPPPPPPTPPNIQPQSFSLESKINPSILLIIIILSIIFFISGLLHLLIRLLLRPTTQQSREDDDELYRDHASVLQGQLQQLFHLHDSGVDQSYIDTLPVFMYKSIIGLKDPFDCAVCLCEFEMDDCLRLLPKCSHAFHMDCIDTWLLSHSTCPLCRSSLLSEHRSVPNISSPFVCVLESSSGEDSAREIGGERNSVSGSLGNEAEFGSGRVGFSRKSCDGKITGSEFGSGRVGLPRKTYDGKITRNESCDVNEKNEEKIVFVKLGKFMNVDVGEGSNNNEHNIINNNTNNNNNIISSGKDDLGSRRCYSMGSFAYVLDEATSLQVVPIKNTTQMKKKTSSSKKPRVPLKLGHRATMSEYGFDSQREFNGIEALKTIDSPRIIEGCQNNNGYVNGIERMSNRRESFSISKIWGRGNNKRLGNDHHESSRRTNNSEFEIEVNELGVDRDETLSCYSVDSLVNPTTNYNSTNLLFP